MRFAIAPRLIVRMSAPSSITEPFVIGTDAFNARSNVVFPAPFAPNKTMILPGGRSNEMSFNTCRPSYATESSLISIT
jgi:hypothetical protein